MGASALGDLSQPGPQDVAGGDGVLPDEAVELHATLCGKVRVEVSDLASIPQNCHPRGRAIY